MTTPGYDQETQRLSFSVDSHHRPEWQASSKCAKHYGPGHMFPDGERGAVGRKRKDGTPKPRNRAQMEIYVRDQVCKGEDGLGVCPVQEECYLFAVHTFTHDGVAGGFTSQERHELRMNRNGKKEEKTEVDADSEESLASV